jgi:predicted ATPase/DNA-binding XRE family transcriptional regulator
MNGDAPFGRWLKQRRKQFDLTQAMLAEQVGCAAETLRKIEAGRLRPSRQIATRLAECLQVPEAGRDAFVQAARGAPVFTASAVSHPASPSPSPERFRLPAPLTPLIGREAELHELDALLAGDATRLVTFVGPPGIGKTRLALALAAEHQGRYADGAVFVDLAPLRDSALVAGTIATTLGLREDSATSPTDRLTQFLAGRQLLLVLDNYEQVVEAAPLVTTLLRAAPGLQALATSRVPLHLSGEQRYAVPPLALPDAQASPTAARVAASAAVQLFVARARAVRYTFALTEANAAAVAEICRRLDGLPLAIELAAAQIARFEPHALLAQLAPLLPLLGDGPRDAPARQRTLRRAIAWSYDLLPPNEQSLFRRLSVFAGTFTMEAIEAVCSAADSLSNDVIQDVAALCDKHLLQRQLRRNEQELLFVMLEAIRAYGEEQLNASGEATMLRFLHAEYYQMLVETAETQLRGATQLQWLARLEAERDNLRAVLDWAIGQGQAEAESGLRFAASLWLFWHMRGYVREGRMWLERALATEMNTTRPTRAKALNATGWLALFQGDYDKAQEFLEQSLMLYRELGDTEGAVAALTNMGFVATLGQRNLGQLPVLLNEAIALRPQLQDQHTMANLLIFAGLAALIQNDRKQAIALHEESLVMYRRLGDPQGMGMCLTNLGLMALTELDLDRAVLLLRENLLIARSVEDKLVLQYSFLGLAGVATASGNPVRAARLWGAAEALSEVCGFHLTSLARAQTNYDGLVSAAYTQLGETAFTAAWTEGRGMMLEEAIAYAQELTDAGKLGIKE